MTGRGPAEDRALNAVRRVRGSREQDSRLGLRHALDAAQRREAELVAARARRSSISGFTTGTPADFARHLAHAGAVAGLEAQAAERVESSRVVADEAIRRWQQDRQRVRVVDLLLERRAEQRDKERRRREDRVLDDLAAQVWLRHREGEA
jgi:hypothetical protein